MSANVNTSESGTITITPEKPTAAIIFLHGLGESNQIWTDRMTALSKQLPHVKFVLPSATVRSVTLHDGKSMPAWFDIPTAEGIDEARSLATALIDNELLMNHSFSWSVGEQVSAGIPHSRIVVGGFNQGGALSYFTAFQMAEALGGFLALSSTIPKPHAFAVTPEAKSVPALICHGDADPTVVFSRAQSAVKTLQEAGVELDFRVYPGMEHTVTAEELADVRVWLQKVLPEASSA